MGDSGKNMQALAKDADVKEGERFPKNISKEDLADWAKQYL